MSYVSPAVTYLVNEKLSFVLEGIDASIILTHEIVLTDSFSPTSEEDADRLKKK